MTLLRRTTLALHLLVVGSLCTVLVSCSSESSPPSAQADRTIVVAVANEPSGFNWNKSGHDTQTTNDLAQNLFFYAFKSGPGFERTFPGLEGGQPPRVISADPQVVEWKIDRRAKWSDDTPVTTADLVHFRDSILAPDSEAAEHEGYDQMTALDAIDDKTIRATFNPAYADYENLWTTVPQAAFMRTQPGVFPGLEDEPGPSAGPFAFEEWKRGESITLVRNESWWGEPAPRLDKIVFRFIPDAAAQVDALANGEVDLITADADADLVSRLEELAATDDIRYELRSGPKWDLLTFNVTNPILADLRVRQAIAHALDRNDILDKVMRPIDGDAQRLDNFIYMSNQPDYEAHGAQYATRDLDAARRLLEEAGWTPGPGGTRQKDGTELSLRMSAISGFSRLEDAAELAIAQLAEVGIELRSDDCPIDCLFERVLAADFDIISAFWDGGVFPVSVISHIFTTGGTQNFGKFSSPVFDDLIGQAASVATADQQADIANRADEELWAQLPGVTLYQVPRLFAASNRFVGMAANPTGDGVFWNSNTWGPRA